MLSFYSPDGSGLTSEAMTVAAWHDEDRPHIKSTTMMFLSRCCYVVTNVPKNDDREYALVVLDLSHLTLACVSVQRHRCSPSG